MINEEKVLRMTHMASYEAKGGKKDKAVAGYFKADYVGMQLVVSFVVITAAFLIAFAAYLSFQFEQVIAEIYSMDLVAESKRILMIYLIVTLSYMAVTYVIYTIRYVKARRRLNRFMEHLNCLDGTKEEEES